MNNQKRKLVSVADDYLGYQDNYGKFHSENVIIEHAEGNSTYSGKFEEHRVYYKNPNGIGNLRVTEHKNNVYVIMKSWGDRKSFYISQRLDINIPLDKILIEMYLDIQDKVFRNVLSRNNKINPDGLSPSDIDMKSDTSDILLADMKSLISEDPKQPGKYMLYRELINKPGWKNESGLCKISYPNKKGVKIPVKDWSILEDHSFDAVVTCEVFRYFQPKKTLKANIYEILILSSPEKGGGSNQTIMEAAKEIKEEENEHMNDFFNRLNESNFSKNDVQGALDGNFNEGDYGNIKLPGNM